MTIERHLITSESDWLAWRQCDITGSEVGALCGVDPRPEKSPAHIYWQKRGLLQPIADSSVLRRGRWLEHAFPRALRDERPAWKLSKAEHYWRDPQLRLGGTPDYLIEGDPRGFGVLEAKTVEADVYDKYYTSEWPAPWVAVQLTTYLMLTGFSWGAIGVLVLGYRRCDLEIYEMARHAGAEKKITDTVAEFWRNVNDGVEPELDYTRDASLLALIFPHEQPGKVADLRADNRLPDLLTRHDRYTKLAKHIESRRQELSAEIRHKIGDAERALVLGWQVSLKTQKRKAHEVAATEFRVLRAKKEA